MFVWGSLALTKAPKIHLPPNHSRVGVKNRIMENTIT